MKYASQLISLIFGHLDVGISRRGWGSGGRWCFDLFGNHRLQVNVYLLVFEDTEVPLGGDSRLVRAFWTKNTY